MSEAVNSEQSRDSRRKFIKGAAAAVYVAPLVVSMEAKANFQSNGSKEVVQAGRCYEINGRIACE